MKPLTSSELLNLPLGTKIKLHPKLVAYQSKIFKTSKRVLEAIHSLAEARATPDDSAYVVALNDDFDDERVTTVIDKHGWSSVKLEPGFVLANTVASSHSLPSHKPQNVDVSGTFCSCANPSLVRRSIGVGCDYDYCKLCKKERKERA